MPCGTVGKRNRSRRRIEAAKQKVISWKFRK